MNNEHPTIKNLLQQYPQLTSETTVQNITTAPYQYRIDTRHHVPIMVRDYRRAPAENKIIEELVQAMLKKKVIEPSDSSWSSPIVLIQKLNGQYRFCLDFRKLNSITRRDVYPLPNITELLDQLHGSKYFTTLDLHFGYWQIPMHPDDACKTAFTANGALYQFTCLPYGCTNGPASFQRCMRYILQGQKNCMVYLDDVLLHTKDLQQHLTRLKELLALLDKYNLRLSLKKCQFLQKQVNYLGFVIMGNGIKPDPKKTAAIAKWEVPQYTKEVQKFLGFCAFHH
ncbi:hypothetical protein INT45_011144 [Circinella minor]|uniref:Reverse transcriptase domain-containing protein n=1 Tax=Circinella minor TaxID=1195481 RepID=A0A8H7VR67_9FUNG|nr:hypothetical protein INT45_011144 [Circinella minor]